MEQSGKFSWSAAAFWDIPYPVTRRIASSLYSTEYFVVCFLRLMPLSPCNLYFVTHLRTNESEIERWSAVPCQIVLNDGKSEFIWIFCHKKLHPLKSVRCPTFGVQFRSGLFLPAGFESSSVYIPLTKKMMILRIPKLRSYPPPTLPKQRDETAYRLPAGWIFRKNAT